MGKRIRAKEKIKVLTLEQEHVIVIRAYKRLHERYKELQDNYMALLSDD